MPANKFCEHEGKHVLLVEGLDDCHVIMALCKAHNVPQHFGLYDCGNDDRVLKRANALVVQPQAPQIIGIVLDADNGTDRRWQSIKDKLKDYDYRFPETLPAEGTIIKTINGLPRLGVWLMPNNQVQGMLEDLCLDMVDVHTRGVVAQAVQDAQDAGVCTFKQVHFSKAVVHTYLAWQDEPGFPLGLSITRTALKPSTQTATLFTDWLKRLFDTAE